MNIRYISAIALTLFYTQFSTKAQNLSSGASARVGKFSGNALVTIEMGNVIFRIPEAYLLISPTHDDANRPEGLRFALLALLPDFSPKTPENRKYFDEKGWGNKVNIFIDYKGYAKTGMDLFLFNRSFYKSSEIRSGNYGYYVFGDSDSKVGLDYLFKGSIEAPHDFVECDKSDSVPYPSCNRIILVGRDIVVKYTVSRKYLDVMSRIDGDLISFLNGLRINGPTLEFIQ